MQGSSSDSFEKKVKRSKGYDDGYGGRQNNKKQDYHRQSRAKGQTKKSFE